MVTDYRLLVGVVAALAALRLANGYQTLTHDAPVQMVVHAPLWDPACTDKDLLLEIVCPIPTCQILG